MNAFIVIDKNFEYEKGVLRKMSPFLDNFFGGGENGGGRQFFKFFTKYFESSIYKCCKVQKGL
jgi:hypothetical protein